MAAGLLIETGVDGLFGRSGDFEDVVEAVDALVTRESRRDGAERLRFPPAMPRREFERSEYLKGFPELAGTVHCFCGDERAHRDLLRQVEAGEDWTAGQVASDIVLAPAACYATYPVVARRGRMPDGGRTMDVMSWCFRREPSLEPTRMQLFRMREIVRIAAPHEIAGFREDWIERAGRLVSSLGLDHEVETANDPFFGRIGKLKADVQRSQQLKFELLIPVNPDAGPTACVSFNNHQDHFGLLWDIHTADGGLAHSGCVAFGLERMALALFRKHGLAPTAWPAAVRCVLWP